jgi:hypothetical protein
MFRSSVLLRFIVPIEHHQEGFDDLFGHQGRRGLILYQHKCSHVENASCPQGDDTYFVVCCDAKAELLLRDTVQEADMAHVVGSNALETCGLSVRMSWHTAQNHVCSEPMQRKHSETCIVCQSTTLSSAWTLLFQGRQYQRSRTNAVLEIPKCA